MQFTSTVCSRFLQLLDELASSPTSSTAAYFWSPCFTRPEAGSDDVILLLSTGSDSLHICTCKKTHIQNQLFITVHAHTLLDGHQDGYRYLYQLTQVVLETGCWNECCCCSVELFFKQSSWSVHVSHCLPQNTFAIVGVRFLHTRCTSWCPTDCKSPIGNTT